MDDWKRQRPGLLDNVGAPQICILAAAGVALVTLLFTVVAVAVSPMGGGMGQQHLVTLKRTNEVFGQMEPQMSGMAGVYIPMPTEPYFGGDEDQPLPKPQCVDGSDALYYFRQSNKRDFRDVHLRWVIHLGGSNIVPVSMEWDDKLGQPKGKTERSSAGSNFQVRTESAKGEMYNPGVFTCHNKATCNTQRTLTTSALNPPFIYLDGLLSDNPTINPDFFDANHVFIPYCSADLWLGRSTALNTDYEDDETGADELLWRGQDILDGVMTDLLRHGMREAREILISGTNEGGLGVLYHLDRLREVLPSTAYVMGLNDGGLLFDHVTFNHKDLFAGFSRWGALACPGSVQRGREDAELEAIHDGRPQAAEELSPQDLADAYSCYIGWDYFAVVDTPIFFTMSQFNHFQLGSMGFDVRAKPNLKTRDLMVTFMRRATADLEAMVKGKAEVTSRVEAGVQLYVRDGNLYEMGPAEPSKHVTRITGAVKDAAKAAVRQVAAAAAVAQPASSGKFVEPATKVTDTVETVAQPASDAQTETAQKPPDLASAGSAAAGAPGQGEENPPSETKVKKSADSETPDMSYTATQREPVADVYGQDGHHPQDSLDPHIIGHLDLAELPPTPAQYGLVLGNLWRVPIPKPLVRLGVFAPVCRHTYGVLSQKAFGDASEYAIEGVTFRDAFGSFYFQRDHAKIHAQHPPPPAPDPKKKTVQLGNGVFKAGKKHAVVTIYLEELTNCTRCMVDYSNRALETVLKSKGLFERLQQSRVPRKRVNHTVPHGKHAGHHGGQDQFGSNPQKDHGSATGATSPHMFRRPHAQGHAQGEDMAAMDHAHQKVKKSAEEDGAEDKAGGASTAPVGDATTTPSVRRARAPFGGKGAQAGTGEPSAGVGTPPPPPFTHKTGQAAMGAAEAEAGVAKLPPFLPPFQMPKPMPKPGTPEWKEFHTKLMEWRKAKADAVYASKQRTEAVGAIGMGKDFKLERSTIPDARIARNEMMSMGHDAFVGHKKPEVDSSAADVDGVADELKRKEKLQLFKDKLLEKRKNRQTRQRFKQYQATQGVDSTTPSIDNTPGLLKRSKVDPKVVPVGTAQDVRSAKVLSQMKLVKLGELALQLFVKPPVTTFVAGNLAIFCVENPLQLPIDLTSVRAMVIAPDASRRMLALLPGVSAEPQGLIKVAETSRDRPVMQAPAYCFSLRPQLAGSYAVSVQVHESPPSTDQYSIRGSPFTVKVHPAKMSVQKSTVHGMQTYHPNILSRTFQRSSRHSVDVQALKEKLKMHKGMGLPNSRPFVSSTAAVGANQPGFGRKNFTLPGMQRSGIGGRMRRGMETGGGMGMETGGMFNMDMGSAGAYSGGMGGGKFGMGGKIGMGGGKHGEGGMGSPPSAEDEMTPAPFKRKNRPTLGNKPGMGAGGAGPDAAAADAKRAKRLREKIRRGPGMGRKPSVPVPEDGDAAVPVPPVSSDPPHGEKKSADDDDAESQLVKKSEAGEEAQKKQDHSDARMANDLRHDDSFVVSVTGRDEFGNLVTDGGDTVYIRFVGPSIVTPRVIDHQNGTYSARVRLEEPGSYRADVMLLRVSGRSSRSFTASSHIAQSPYNIGLAEIHKRARDRLMRSTADLAEASKLEGKAGEMAKEKLHAISDHTVHQFDFDKKKIEKFLAYKIKTESRESCDAVIHRNQHKVLEAGSWVSKQLVSQRIGEWGTVVNSTMHGNYRWLHPDCVPRMVTPAMCEDCLSEQWVHIVGDGTSRDMFRLLKSMLVAASATQEAETTSVSEQVSMVVDPALEWWQKQMYKRYAHTPLHVTKGYNEQTAANMASKFLWMYRYHGHDNTSLTWSPFRDTPHMRKMKTDPLSRVADLKIKPDVVLMSLSTLKLCEKSPTEFVVYLNGLIQHVRETSKGVRVVFLLPPAVHDSIYHERFRTCSYKKIQRRAEVMAAKLAGQFEFVNLWEMTSGRPDATLEGSRYTWATAPEPAREDSWGSEVVEHVLRKGPDGFQGPVGWSMVNQVLNRLCAGRLKMLSGHDLEMAERSQLESVFHATQPEGAIAQRSQWMRVTMIVGAMAGVAILAFAVVALYLARHKDSIMKRLV